MYLPRRGILLKVNNRNEQLTNLAGKPKGDNSMLVKRIRSELQRFDVPQVP